MSTDGFDGMGLLGYSDFGQIMSRFSASIDGVETEDISELIE